MASSFSPTEMPGGAPPREDSPPPAAPQSPSPSSPEPSAPLSPFYQTVLVGVSASAPTSAAVIESPCQTPLHSTPEATSGPISTEITSEPVSEQILMTPMDFICEFACEFVTDTMTTQKLMTPEATPLRETERMQSVISTTETATPALEVGRMESVVSTTEKATPARQSEPEQKGRLKIEQDGPPSEVKIAKATKPGKRSSTLKRPAESEAMSSRRTKQKFTPNTDLGPRTLRLYTEHASSRDPITVHLNPLVRHSALLQGIIDNAAQSDTKPLIKIEPGFEPVKAEAPSPPITLIGDSLILPGYDIDLLGILSRFVYSGKISSRREADADIDVDTPEDPEWARLFSAWKLGARLQSTSFMDAVSDAIVAKLPVSMIAASLDGELLAHAGQESAMRKLLVEIVALAWTDESFELENLRAGDEHFRLMTLLLLGKTRTMTAKPRKLWFKKKGPYKSESELREKKEKKDKKRKHEEVAADGDDAAAAAKKEKKKKRKSEVVDVDDTIVTDAPAATSTAVVAVKDEEDEKKDLKMVIPVSALVPFANPLADEKQQKKVLKGVKRAAKHNSLKRGVKEVVKAIRKSPASNPSLAPTTLPNGIVILAADISPMDVISHIPVLCEDHGIPYIFVPSRAELGAAGSTKRPTSVVMCMPGQGKGAKEGEKAEWEEGFGELHKVALKLGQHVLV
ncbi:hypothetical protein B0A48_04294 [Cryoendolithus antarcticus]|uniref:Ribosomal protein eL8/eL30/eS12/Gadd45 domain-containing protein n=1 Tax=Cryoendolithus antarcticus TaxID=1507870 RepID=A0A1V8TEY5_9PEZI|nr:hypothetical protein B0A48_04294 [Cryoendolithus antarcticus]